MVATNKLAAVMAEVVGGGAGAAINAGSRKHLFRDKARVTPQVIYLLSRNTQ